MLRVILDTNVLVQFVCSVFAGSPSRTLMELLKAGAFRLIVSEAVLAELNQTLKTSTLKSKHRMSELDIDDFCEFIRSKSEVFEPAADSSHALTHDPSDTKFLDLAIASDADFFVTKDARHLLRLRRIGRTKIVTPHKFLLALKR